MFVIWIFYLERFGIHNDDGGDTEGTGDRQWILVEEPAVENRPPAEAVAAGREGNSWRRLGKCRSAIGYAGLR